MNNNSLDLRAYSLLLDELRRTCKNELTCEEDIIMMPTHRLEDLLIKKNNSIVILREQLNYVATKIRHIKEESNFHHIKEESNL